MKIKDCNLLIEGLTRLVLIFLSIYFVSKCQENKPEKQITNEKEIIKIDSAINAIPFKYTDSSRASFIKNYQKFR